MGGNCRLFSGFCSGSAVGSVKKTTSHAIVSVGATVPRQEEQISRGIRVQAAVAGMDREPDCDSVG